MKQKHIRMSLPLISGGMLIIWVILLFSKNWSPAYLLDEGFVTGIVVSIVAVSMLVAGEVETYGATYDAEDHTFVRSSHFIIAILSLSLLFAVAWKRGEIKQQTKCAKTQTTVACFMVNPTYQQIVAERDVALASIGKELDDGKITVREWSEKRKAVISVSETKMTELLSTLNKEK